MAEIIGTFASIATIASLAGPTARLLRTMRKIAKDSDHVAKDIDIIASQVEMASVGLDIALRQLEGHCLTMQHIRETPSDVTNYIVKHNLTEAIVRGSKGIKRHMKDVKLELNSLNRNSRVIKGLKWYLWAKMEVESLLPQFQLVISCLSLVCPILSLEICIHHSRTLGEKFASQFQPEM